MKRLSLPLVAILLLTATACSSSQESDAPKVTTGSSNAPRTKNAALPGTKKRVLTQNPDTGVLSDKRPKEVSTFSSDTSVSVDVQSQNPVIVPSNFCSLIKVQCSSLDFAQIEVTGVNSFTATAEIPNASIALPSGNGFGFKVLKTAAQVFVEGKDLRFAINAETELTMEGSTIPLQLTGRFIPADATIEVEVTNNNLNVKDLLGIPGFDVSSITGKTTFVGGAPKGIGFSITGKVPTMLKELGINPNTKFTAAMEMGLGVTVGMSFGSQDEGSPNIVNIQNILSARYLAFSYSAQGATIAGVEYPKGAALSFDGSFGNVPVVVDGNVSYTPLEYNLNFNVGAFSVGGFNFEETTGAMQRDDSGFKLKFSGALKGNGIDARMSGSFDALGGIAMDGSGTFVPGGVDLGSLKLRFKSDKNGVEFLGEGRNNFGVVTGSQTVGFKSFAGNKIGFTLGMSSGLQIPGVPSYASVSGGLSVTNCPDMKCTTPTTTPVATLSGSAQFYGSPKQSFSVDVNPNNWGFRKELSFAYDKGASYSSNGFSIGANAKGNGSVVISDKGITFGKGSMSASAGFEIPSTYWPAVTVVPTKTRLSRLVCKGWTCRSEMYWSYAGGQTIVPAYRIPAIKVYLEASVGIDDRGFYINVSGNDRVKGNRLYFS